MGKLFDEQGNEVEAFTQEELEAKQQEAVDKYASENPSKNDELETAKSELEEANKKLKEYGEANGGDDDQKKRLKEKAKTAEEKLDDVTTKFTQELKDLKEGILSGHKTKILERLSGGDKEIEEKIKFEAEKYSGDPANEIELEQRLTNAATIVNLATPIPNFTDNLSGAGNRGDKQAHEINKPENDNSKAMRNVLGITDEDVQKYGSQDGEKKE